MATNDAIHNEVVNEIISVEATKIVPAQVHAAMQCLIDNGIEEDEASSVLQALGYILLDAELFPNY